MRAAVFTETGGDLTIEELEPTPPGPRDVIVDLGASGVCHSDLSLKNGYVPIMQQPDALGHRTLESLAARDQAHGAYRLWIRVRRPRHDASTTRYLPGIVSVSTTRASAAPGKRAERRVATPPRAWRGRSSSGVKKSEVNTRCALCAPTWKLNRSECAAFRNRVS